MLLKDFESPILTVHILELIKLIITHNIQADYPYMHRYVFIQHLEQLTAQITLKLVHNQH